MCVLQAGVHFLSLCERVRGCVLLWVAVGSMALLAPTHTPTPSHTHTHSLALSLALLLSVSCPLSVWHGFSLCPQLLLA
jgi:hypothetical protein